jgi:hypothetical protein
MPTHFLNTLPEAQSSWKKGGLSAKNQQILAFYGLIIHKDRCNAKICSLMLSIKISGCQSRIRCIPL